MIATHPRYQSPSQRKAKIRAAIVLLAKCQPPYGLNYACTADLTEAIGLLGSVLRGLDAHL